jgi:hypothetical protein
MFATPAAQQPDLIRPVSLGVAGMAKPVRSGVRNRSAGLMTARSGPLRGDRFAGAATQQPRFELAAEHSPNAEFFQERFIHWCVETVNAQMSRGGERLDTRNRFDRDARSGVHADVDCHEAGAGEGDGIKRLQRKVDARHLEARLFQPCGGLCERERLAPQFVRIVVRLKRRISLPGLRSQEYAGERGELFRGVKHSGTRTGIEVHPLTLDPSDHLTWALLTWATSLAHGSLAPSCAWYCPILLPGGSVAQRSSE